MARLAVPALRCTGVCFMSMAGPHAAVPVPPASRLGGSLPSDTALLLQAMWMARKFLSWPVLCSSAGCTYSAGWRPCAAGPSQGSAAWLWRPPGGLLSCCYEPIWRTLLCRRPYLTRCAMNHEGSLQACPAIAGAVPRVFAWVCTMQRGTTITYCECLPLAAAATVQLKQQLRGSQQQAGTRVCRACSGMESPSTSAKWPRAMLKIE